MTARFRTTLLAAAALAATLAGVAAPARAEMPSTAGSTLLTPVQYRGDGDGWRGPHRRDWDERGGPRFEDRRERGICRPGLALEKARAFGLRGVDIVDVGRRRVVVEGFRRGGRPVLVTFAQARGCPVIDRR